MCIRDRVKVEIYDECIYVEEILYRSGLTVTELANYLKSLNLGRAEIYADAAEPKSIEEIYRYGMNIKPADKDVWAGILKVKSMPLYLSLIHISEPTRLLSISYAVFC